jgi:hypothetical protein
LTGTMDARIAAFGPVPEGLLSWWIIPNTLHGSLRAGGCTDTPPAEPAAGLRLPPAGNSAGNSAQDEANDGTGTADTRS